MNLTLLRDGIRAAAGHNISALAASLAYSGALALPAMLLLVVGLFGLTASPATVDQIVNSFEGIAPSSVLQLVDDSLRRITGDHSASETAALVGGAIALWTVSGAMNRLQWALNICHDLPETRSALRRRLNGLLMFSCMLLAITLTFGLLVAGPQLSGWTGERIGSHRVVSWLWWTLQWPIQVAGLLLVFAVVLKLGPNHGGRPWRFRTPGALVAVAIWLVASSGFALYTSTFGSYSKLWGSLAAPIVLLVWLWLSALAILIGAEVDRVAVSDRPPSRADPAPDPC